MAITPEQVKEWLTSKETEHLEFKKAENQIDTNDLMRYCIALANEGGGKLVLGISNELPRTIVGSAALPHFPTIKSKVFDKLRLRIEIEEITVDGGRVVVVDIPSRPRGTALEIDGSYLMRVGESLRPMSPDQLRRIFDEGKPDFLSEISTDGLSEEDVIRLLDTTVYFDLLNLGYPATRASVLERFESETFIVARDSGYGITNLGALLFAKQLSDFPSLARKAPRVLVYEGRSKLKTRSDLLGKRGYVVDFEGLIDYINSQLPTNHVIHKAFREDAKMFPEIAIRELVANALVHQDFTIDGIFVSVEIYSDRIEITNPGPSPIMPDRLIDCYQSRNEALAEIMRRLRICERQGSGIDKVIFAIEDWQLPAPAFRNGERQFTAIMYSQIPFEKMSKKDKIRACYQHCVLKIMMNERMTNQSLRDRFDLPESKADVASQIIRNTIDAGLIRLEDPDSTSKRYARYVPYWE